MGIWHTFSRGRSVTVSVICALAVLALAPQCSSARDFRAADTQSEDYPTVQALLFMGRLVEERTGGRHHIRVFPSRQLGEEKETIEQTRVGAIELNRVSVAPLAGFVPEAGALAMPFLFRSIEHLHRVLDGPIGANFLSKLSPYGFVGLAFYDAGSRSIYNSVRPVHSVADLAGLRIRVQQSDLASGMVRALGAIPVELPFGQVTTSLSTSLVDGAENNWPSYVATGHYTLARYITLTEHTMTPDVLLMSRKAWDALDPDDQVIFKRAAEESSQFMRREWLAWEVRAQQQAKDSGNVIVQDVDKAPFVAAMSSIYTKVEADPGMKALIERIQAEP